jgi:hypothetical protein
MPDTEQNDDILRIHSMLNPTLFTYSKVFGAILFFVIWILMLLSFFKILRARDLGRRTQEQCGAEHMERETWRYIVIKEFDVIKNYFVAIIVLLVFIHFMIVIPVFWAFFTKIMDINKPATATPPSPIPWWQKKWIHITVLLLVGMAYISNIIAFLSSLQNEHKLSNYGKKQSAELSTYWAAFSLLMFQFVVMLVVLYASKVQHDFLLYIVATIGLLLSIYYFVKNYTRFYNKVSKRYTDAATSLNADIKTLVSTNEVRTYFERNIKRSNPDIIGTPNVQSYTNELYSYIMHQNGKENINGSSDLRTLADVKAMMYVPNTVSLSNASLTVAIDAIRKTDTSSNTDKLTIYNAPLNVQYRTYAINLLYQDKYPNGVVTHCNVTDVINAYNGISADQRTNVLKLFTKDEYKLFRDADRTSINVNNSFYMDDTYTLLQQAYNQKTIATKAIVDDIQNCFYLRMNEYDGVPVKLSDVITRLDRTIDQLPSSGGGIYSVLDAIRMFIKSKQSNKGLREKIQRLRTLDTEMKNYTNAFLSTLTWIFMSTFTLCLFAVYHYLYRTYESFKLVVCIGLFLAFVLVTFFAWGFGNSN